MRGLKRWFWDDTALCVGTLSVSVFYLLFATLMGRVVLLPESLFTLLVTGGLMFFVPVTMIVGVAVPVGALIYIQWRSEEPTDNLGTCAAIMASSFAFCLLAEAIFQQIV